MPRASWYSQLPAFGWFDPEDRPGSAAYRVAGRPIPDSQQGIALPSRGGLGKWYNVTPPGGNLPFPMQQTDIGPAKWTGRGVDISAAAAHQMGYTPKNFPTDADWKIEPRDEPRGLGSPAGMPAQAGDIPDNTDETQTPYAGGPAPSRGRKMPSSLLDMFQPKDPAGEPVGFGDAVTSRSNSLIGLGLGLLAPSNPLRGQSSWGQALEGFQGGAQLDARTAAAASQRRQHAADRAQSMAQHARDRAQAQSNFERTFAAGQQSPFSKVAADLGLQPGTPEYVEAARQYHQPKTDPAWEVIHIPDPNDPDNKIPMWANKRTQEMKPLQPGATGAPGVPAATPGLAPAPLPVLPPPAPEAVPGTRTAFDNRFGDWGPAAGTVPATTPVDPNAPVVTAPTPPRGQADLPPRVGLKAFDNEEKLRKEFNAATKPHQEVRQSYNRLLAAKDNAAGDIALIFGYMRMLDPGSVVREGEFATAQNAAGIPDMVRNMYNRALSGERLNPTQREQFKDQAGSIYEKYDQEYSARAEQFRGIAKQNRIDPSRVIPDLGPAPKAAEKTAGDPLAEARDAIKRGAPRAAVIERLAKSGVRFNPKDLD